MRIEHKSSSSLPIDLYKNTRRERLNLYRCLLSATGWHTELSGTDVSPLYKNPVVARHPIASRLRKRHLMRGPQGAELSQYIGTKGADAFTVLLGSLNAVTA
jgi:hypothetical protein